MVGKSILVDGVELVVTGTVFKTASVKYEWDVTLANPESLITNLRTTRLGADVFTFRQRLPESRRKYPYAMEWDNVAAIPITDYQTWLWKQIHRNARNKLKKAEKEGVVVRTVECNDALFQRIKEIQDECPIRQGARFQHYGKDLETVRRGHGTFLDRATFLGAFFKEEMIGYLKVVQTVGSARVMGLLTKIRYNEKAPMNALIAKAVEICAEKRIPFLAYAKYSYGGSESTTLIEFKTFNGFEHILLPRYYVPLTWKGGLALRLRYQHGLAEYLPRPVIQLGRSLRARYLEWRFRDMLIRSQPTRSDGATKAAVATPREA